MTTENLLEAWKNRVKKIFKEAEEFEPAVGNADEVEAPTGDIGGEAEGNALPVDGNAEGNAVGNALPGAEDESLSKEPITLTKGLLVQLLDAAVQSAKGEELPALGNAEGNAAVGNAVGNVDAAVAAVDVPAEPLAPEKDKPFGEAHKKKGEEFLAKFKKDDKKEEKKVEETKDKKNDDKKVVKEDETTGVVPNLEVVPPAAGNAAVGNAPAAGNLPPVDGNAEGNALDLELDAGAAFDVSSLVDKAFELFAGKQDGSPLDVDVLEVLKGAASGTPVEGGAEGNADFAAAGNAPAPVVGNAEGNAEGNTEGNADEEKEEPVEEAKVATKKKIKFT